MGLCCAHLLSLAQTHNFIPQILIAQDWIRELTVRSNCRAGEQAARAFAELAGILGQAPDPEPYLNAIGPLQERIGQLQRENRRLQLHGQAADSEASSASQAVVKNRELERENADLKAQLTDKVHKFAPLC